MAIKDMSWSEKGHCYGLPTKERLAIFFPPSKKETTDLRNYREARALLFCAECKVSQECLAFAADEDNKIEEGVWGGLTGEQVQKYIADSILCKRVFLLIMVCNEPLVDYDFGDGGD